MFSPAYGRPLPPGDPSRAAADVLGRVFADHFCPAQDVPADRRGQIEPKFFFDWCATYLATLDGDAVCRAAGVDAGWWPHVLDLGSDPAASLRTRQVWAHIALYGRPAPRQGLKEVAVALLLRWEDGTILPVTARCRPEIQPEAAALTDADVGMFLALHGLRLAEPVLAEGLDRLHAQGEQMGDEAAFNTAIGCIHKLVPDLAAGVRDTVKKWARMFVGVFAPPIPPAALAQARADVRRRADKGHPAGPGVRAQRPPAQGGWDA